MNCDAVKNEKGFTILEILASVALLSIGLVALASMQVIGMKGNLGGEERSVATAIIASKIQELSSLRYEMDSDSGASYTDPDLAAVSMSTPIKVNASGFTAEQMVSKYGSDSANNTNDFKYDLSWSIQDVGDQNGPGSYKNITITVSWFDRSTKGINDLVNPRIVVTTFPLSPRFL